MLLEKIANGVFAPLFPVYLVVDEPTDRYVEVEFPTEPIADDPALDADQRRYASRTVKQRLHQRSFSAAVLRAYDGRCAVCGLPFVEVLEAVHIVGDAAGGQPVVSNGIAMCSLHHAAYDDHLIGIRPDYTITVHRVILDDPVESPMVRHAFRELHGARLTVPTRRVDRPDPQLLDRAYAVFTVARPVGRRR